MPTHIREHYGSRLVPITSSRRILSNSRRSSGDKENHSELSLTSPHLLQFTHPTRCLPSRSTCRSSAPHFAQVVMSRSQITLDARLASRVHQPVAMA